MSILYTPDHFAVAELVDRQTFADRGIKALLLFDPHILEIIDVLRDIYGPAFINTWALSKAVRNTYGDRTESGLRLPYHSHYRKYSQHSYGRAFDMLFKDILTVDVREQIIDGTIVLPYNVILETGISWLHIAVGNYEDKVTLVSA